MGLVTWCGVPSSLNLAKQKRGGDLTMIVVGGREGEGG